MENRRFITVDFDIKNTNQSITLSFKNFSEAFSFEKRNKDVLTLTDFQEFIDDTPVNQEEENFKVTY